MIEADNVISPSMTDREASELAYGLLWMIGCDRSTQTGEALYLARKALYEKMDRDGQARGIAAARTALGECNYAEAPAWVDAAALQAAREIVALAGPVPAYQKIAAIQTIVAREMMRTTK